MGAHRLLARDLAALADTVAALPRIGPLPTTTIVVPSSSLGHALRRLLIESGRGAVLAGARFIPAGALAIEILRSAGITFETGEDELRAARVLVVLRASLTLRKFPVPLLREAPGWEEAFSLTISDLEAAGLRPEDLDRSAQTLDESEADQLRDVAAVWRTLETSAASSWSAARVLLEAAEFLPQLKPHGGSTLLIVSGHESKALATFLSALPGAQLALVAQQPVSQGFLARVENLYGSELRALANAAPRSISGPRELDFLQTGLFADPAALAEKSRPRSKGIDGSVSLEEQAGVEEEVQSAAEWIGQQVLAGIPLAQLAVLAPRRDPWVALVVERLQRLPWNDGLIPLVVPGGLPCLGFATGSRLLALVQALRSFLAIEHLPGVLVGLRPIGDARSLDHASAIGIAGSLGTVGGSRTRPTGSRDWKTRVAARLAELRELLACELKLPSLDPRELKETTEFSARLIAFQPALDALDGLAELVVARATIRELAPALTKFCETHLLQPSEGMPVAALLAAALAPLVSDRACGELAGDDAMRIIEEAIGELRMARGRYGEPGVFVGTVSEAAGLPFRAVRIIGICEGALPSAPREDPVLPDSLRRALNSPALRTARETVQSQLHTLWRCIAEAKDSVVLSAPRLDPDGGQRQPSAILLDALAALGRPGGEPADLKALRRAAFRPARAETDRKLAASPISTAANLLRTARSGLVPALWHSSASLNLLRSRRLVEQPELEGQLGAGFPMRLLPGVSAMRAISPSSLTKLLGCPHQFLLETILFWRGPGELPGTGQLNPMTYGKLFHATAEHFFEAHGTDFTSRKRSLVQWKKKGAEIAAREFKLLCDVYPLAGDKVREQQLLRLLREFDAFLGTEWTETRQFVSAEIPFGQSIPVRLRMKSGALYVHGRIDRVDIENDRALVRDLKTGRAKPRVGPLQVPTVGIDLQLAVYGMVVKRSAKKLGVPSNVAGAYTYVDRAGERERAFRDDFSTLEKAASGWLDAGLQLLIAREFPRTPNPEDCTYCSFSPVCGSKAIKASANRLAGGDGALGSFLTTKLSEDEKQS